MSLFRRALRRIADTPSGDRLRTYLNYRPPVNIRPIRSNASISDLFPWRVDEVWQTYFEVTNTPSFLFPQEALTDQVTVVVFRSDGSEIDRAKLSLAPFESQPFILAELVGQGNGDIGTFSVFHHAPKAEKLLATTKSHVAERGYVSYKRKGDDLSAIVHGKLHCLSKSPDKPGFDFIHGRLKRAEPYRLQLDLSDCQTFDLIFTNPSSKQQSLDVVFMSATRTELKRERRMIPPRGIDVFRWNNEEQLCGLCEAWGGMPMWRPVVFKHYDTHFNVLHS